MQLQGAAPAHEVDDRARVQRRQARRQRRHVLGVLVGVGRKKSECPARNCQVGCRRRRARCSCQRGEQQAASARHGRGPRCRRRAAARRGTGGSGPSGTCCAPRQQGAVQHRCTDCTTRSRRNAAARPARRHTTHPMAAAMASARSTLVAALLLAAACAASASLRSTLAATATGVEESATNEPVLLMPAILTTAEGAHCARAARLRAPPVCSRCAALSHHIREQRSGPIGRRCGGE